MGPEDYRPVGAVCDALRRMADADTAFAAAASPLRARLQDPAAAADPGAAAADVDAALTQAFGSLLLAYVDPLTELTGELPQLEELALRHGVPGVLPAVRAARSETVRLGATVQAWAAADGPATGAMAETLQITLALMRAVGDALAAITTALAP